MNCLFFRLSCTVCYHRPIFDTLEMLLVHRQGKKHAAGTQYIYIILYVWKLLT
jgi:hypothetical protein